MLTRAGLGVVGQPLDNSHPAVIDTGFGIGANCASFGSWLFNSGCWGRSLSAWQQIAQFSPPPVPPATPAVPLAYSGQSTYSGSAYDVLSQYEAELNAVANQQSADETASLQAWGSLQVPVSADSGSGISAWMIAALVAGGIALFLAVKR